MFSEMLQHRCGKSMLCEFCTLHKWLDHGIMRMINASDNNPHV